MIDALQVQIGGEHYRDQKIQPIEYIHANNLPFIEGCVVKYITRWREKGGIQDLQKVRHYLDLLMQLEGANDQLAGLNIPTHQPVEYAKDVNVSESTGTK